MQEVLALVSVWLSLTFGVPQAREVPMVRIQPPAALATIRYGSAGAVNTGEIVALYDGRINTILLSEGWDSSDPADISVLVHEMVHHLQAESGLQYQCPEERERLAYEAQARWLHLFGKDLETEFELNPMTLKVRTTCMLP